MTGVPARPVHLCFVSTTIYPVLAQTDIHLVGGAEVQQAMIARALRARGHRISVLTCDHGRPDSVTADGVEIHHLPPAGRRGIPGLRRIHPRLTDIVSGLRRIDPDWVYFRCAGGMLAACAWYARSAGKRLLFAAASDHDFLPGAGSRLELRERLLYRAGLWGCDHVLVQNQAQHAMLRERFLREGLVVPNLFAEPRFAAGRPEGPVIWVGTVKPDKRPELFLELAARMPQRRFVVVGGAAGEHAPAADYYRRVQAQARTLPNVEFVGFVPFESVGTWYDGAAALVNTSPREGFPNTFLQAWIRGIPSLSFVAPAIGDERSATIECADVPGMQAELESLLGSGDAWTGASESVRRHFERYHSVDAVCQLYERLFTQVPPHGDARLLPTRSAL